MPIEKMAALTCNACQKEFENEAEQKLHYRSEWHRYNLKRKVAGVPGVTEALFQAKISALVEEKNKLNVTPLTYSCILCGKDYRSLKAHDQHLKSRNHILKASQKPNQAVSATVIKSSSSQTRKPIAAHKQPILRQQDEDSEEDDDDDEWEEVDPDTIDETSEALADVYMNNSAVGHGEEENMEEDDEMLNPAACFVCDLEYESIEACMVHMHKKHGFFIPDIEYLKDPKGFLTYVGLKVKRDFTCLYCSYRCQPFPNLEAVRMHMIAKAHCKVRYGDGGDDEEVELEEFYDYSSSYVDASGKQLVTTEGLANNFEIGTCGSELVITKRNEKGISSVITLGSREFLRYYRQKPCPSPARDVALAISLASRYRSMGIATIQSKEKMVRMKVLRAMNRSGVEAMRTKLGMKNNIIRNLPKNVPY